jgi:diguanylate cyclase
VIMSINLSGRQFNNPDFSKNIHAIIDATQVNPTLLELELTESMLMRNDSKTVSTLNSLHHMGVRIAIDDFGTGYSSLNYLRRFPISTLKIDRSFIRDIAEDADDAAIASAIIVMGQSLNLKVIAEGVENQEQLELLRRRGCDLIQGNHLGRAKPAADIERILLEQLQATSDE